ncbi:hypothetical protein D3C75_1161030 [compost metagenome]
MVAIQHALHQVGRIVTLIKTNEFFMQLAAWLVLQSLEVAARKTCARVSRIKGFCPNLCHAHTVTGARHRQLGIHRITLTVRVARIQNRFGNGIGHAVDSGF